MFLIIKYNDLKYFNDIICRLFLRSQTVSDDEWKDYAKGLIKAEIARKNISLIDLAKKLESMGISETPQNISNKINRGTFGAIFMLQILKAIDCKDIRLI